MQFGFPNIDGHPAVKALLYLYFLPEAAVHYSPWIGVALVVAWVMFWPWFVSSGRFDRFVEWACR